MTIVFDEIAVDLEAPGFEVVETSVGDLVVETVNPDDLFIETVAPPAPMVVPSPDLGSLAIEVLPVPGPEGPPGTGVPGPPGGEYVHTQTSPAATWTVVHNLNTRPAMVLFLDTDPSEQVYTDVTYPDLNTAVVEWPTPVAGIAYAR